MVPGGAPTISRLGLLPWSSADGARGAKKAAGCVISEYRLRKSTRQKYANTRVLSGWTERLWRHPTDSFFASTLTPTPFSSGRVHAMHGYRVIVERNGSTR